MKNLDNKKYRILFSFITILALSVCTAQADPITLRILHVNDFHGFVKSL